MAASLMCGDWNVELRTCLMHGNNLRVLLIFHPLSSDNCSSLTCRYPSVVYLLFVAPESAVEHCFNAQQEQDKCSRLQDLLFYFI